MCAKKSWESNLHLHLCSLFPTWPSVVKTQTHYTWSQRCIASSRHSCNWFLEAQTLLVPPPPVSRESMSLWILYTKESRPLWGPCRVTHSEYISTCTLHGPGGSPWPHKPQSEHAQISLEASSSWRTSVHVMPSHPRYLLGMQEQECVLRVFLEKFEVFCLILFLFLFLSVSPGFFDLLRRSCQVKLLY